MGDDHQADLIPNKPLTDFRAFPLQEVGTVVPVSTVEIDLRSTVGFLVADAAGRLLGRVECPMYGTRPDEPDALSVRSRRFFAPRRMVPADAIREVDDRRRRIGLHVHGDVLPRFL